MRPGDLAAQPPRVRQQMHVAAAQPAHLTAAQPSPGHQQHDQPVPRRPARTQQRDDLLVAGPVHRRLRLAQPVPGPHPPRHPAVLAPGLPGQITVVGHLIQQRHQPRRAVPVATACTTIPRTAVSTPLIRDADRAGAAPGPASNTPGRPPPASAPEAGGPAWASHVMNEANCSTPGLPGPARPCAPAQEQRDRVRVRLRRGLRPVAAEPLMPQERLRDGHDLQILIQHRPVPLPGRQPHRKRPHPLIPRSRAGLPAHLPATSTTPAENRRTTSKNTLPRRHHATGLGTPGEGLRRTETSRLDVADWGRNPAAPEFGRYGMLHVRYGKAVRGQPPRRRNVPSVMGWAVEAVADYAENIRPRFGCADHPALWVTERGGRVKPAEINARFVAYRDALGLPKALSPHSLRHSYVICTAFSA